MLAHVQVPLLCAFPQTSCLDVAGFWILSAGRYRPAGAFVSRFWNLFLLRAQEKDARTFGDPASATCSFYFFRFIQDLTIVIYSKNIFFLKKTNVEISSKLGAGGKPSTRIPPEDS